MAPKRKAPYSPAENSPSKRVTRSNRSAAPIRTSPRKPRPAKRPRPADSDSVVPGSEDERSEDELDIIDQDLLATPSKNPKKTVQIVLPTPTTTRPRNQPAQVFPTSTRRELVEVLQPEPQASPSKRQRTAPVREARKAASLSPQKNQQLITPSQTPPPVPPATSSPNRSPSRRVARGPLSESLHDSLLSQKRAVLQALNHPPILETERDDDEKSTSEIATQQLTDLIEGTVERGEGNSCLLLGPRGSGKTRAIESCISRLEEPPIVIRLSGWVQTNDRLAMREISRQLNSQVSSTLLPEEIQNAVGGDASDDDDDENPFLDQPAQISEAQEFSVPVAHMHMLVSCIPTLGRPAIVVIDAFDLFALHPRQSLLYSLLDTVQSCRAGGGSEGLAVVGLSTRVDTIVLLEKRVKSRFSGRMIRFSAPDRVDHWKNITRGILLPDVSGEDLPEEFIEDWNSSVEDFLADPKTTRVLEETFSITGDIRTLTRLMISPILNLTPSSPWLTGHQLELSATTQRIRPEFPYLHNLSYPSICLLIASYNADICGYPALTFEMLHEYVRNAIRVSSVAPVQLNGGGIGMVKCSRPVLLTAFEQLVSARIFVSVTAASSSIGKEFVKYRCVVNRDDVRKSVEKQGNMSLRRWLGRVQGQ